MLLKEIGKNRDEDGLMERGGMCNYLSDLYRTVSVKDVSLLRHILDLHRPRYSDVYGFPVFSYELRREFLLNLIEKYKQKV